MAVKSNRKTSAYISRNETIQRPTIYMSRVTSVHLHLFDMEFPLILLDQLYIHIDWSLYIY